MKSGFILLFSLLFAFTAIAQQAHFSDDAFKQIELNEGLFSGFMNDEQGEDFTFTMSIPKIEADKSYPLIIALHWAEPNRVLSSETYLTCLAAPGLANLNAIIIAPDGQGKQWYGTSNETRLLEFIDLAKKHWSIDEDKIVVTGFSRGGFGSWQLMQRHPKLFSAAIPVAASIRDSDKAAIPTYHILGAEDELVDVPKTKKNAKSLKKKNNNLHLSILEGLSHYEGCSYTEELQKAGQWLVHTVWQEN